MPATAGAIDEPLRTGSKYGGGSYVDRFSQPLPASVAPPSGVPRVRARGLVRLWHAGQLYRRCHARRRIVRTLARATRAGSSAALIPRPEAMSLPPIVVLVAATTLLRVAFAATTGLGVDESYMIAAGRAFSLGYFDHPPVAWWLSRGAAVLFGSEAPVFVRLPFILLFALSQVLAWRLAGGGRPGLWAAVALNLSPVFGVTTGTWVLPDGPLDAALLGAAVCLTNALRGRGTAWWAAAGLCAGLAMLSKYSAVLVIAGAFLFLLTRRPWAFRQLGPYIAAVVSAAVFSPVLTWNAAHHWASFAFQGDRALGLRFHPLAPLTTLAGEALFVLPWIWLPMILVLVAAFRRGAAWHDRLLAWLAVPPVVAFALVSLWSSQRILFHWAAPGYLMLFPLLGRWIAERTDRAWLRRTVAGTAGLLAAVLLVIATQLQFDWVGGRLAAVMRKDPTAEGIDWTSVRDDLRARGLPRPGLPVAVFNWRDAGKIGYAMGPGVTVICLSPDAREFGFAAPPPAGADALVLSVGPMPEAAARWFVSTQPLADTSIRLDGRVLAPVSVMMGYGLIRQAGPRTTQ